MTFHFGRIDDESRKDKREPASHHWLAELSPDIRDYILAAIRRTGNASTDVKTAAETAILLAERIPYALPKGSVADELELAEDEAKRRGPRWSAIHVLIERFPQ